MQLCVGAIRPRVGKWTKPWGRNLHHSPTADNSAGRAGWGPKFLCLSSSLRAEQGQVRGQAGDQCVTVLSRGSAVAAFPSQAYNRAYAVR